MSWDQTPQLSQKIGRFVASVKMYWLNFILLKSYEMKINIFMFLLILNKNFIY